jgi:RHS repeat-associated protein
VCRWRTGGPAPRGNVTELFESTRATSTTAEDYQLAFAYDAAGNVTSTNGFNFEWDPMGMMRRFVEGDRTFVYTADDERIAILSGTEATWTLRDLRGMLIREYLPSGSSLGTAIFADGFETGDDSCWSEAEPPGTGPYGACSSVVTRNSVHGLGYLLAVQTVEGTASERYFAQPNWLGTPRQWIEDAPSSPDVRNNVLFGYGIEASGSSANSAFSRSLFTAHERDFNTADAIPADDDFDMMHARMYWPMYGRFLSPDPVGGSLGRPKSWNRYAYVQANPTTMIDPTGLLGFPANPCSILPCTNDSITVTDTAIPISGIGGFGGDPTDRRLSMRLTTKPRIEGFWGWLLELTDLVYLTAGGSSLDLMERELKRCEINRFGLIALGFPYGSSSIRLGTLIEDDFYVAPSEENQLHGKGTIKVMSTYGRPERGLGYGSFEAILSPNHDGTGTWSHVLAPDFIGSYNFGNRPLRHGILDVYPWWKVGSAACP